MRIAATSLVEFDRGCGAAREGVGTIGFNRNATLIAFAISSLAGPFRFIERLTRSAAWPSEQDSKDTGDERHCLFIP
jgi:hypothetical protein